jgi:hypothetical protein
VGAEEWDVLRTRFREDAEPPMARRLAS